MLLRGLVAAPAALAVMKPVKTLAKAKKVCSYSGWHSFKLNPNSSASPMKKKNCKQGYSTKFFYGKYKSKLPKSKTNKKGRKVTSPYSIKTYNNSVIYLYQSTTFAQLFGGSTKNSVKVVTYLSESTTNQAAYLTALFNAYYLHSYGYPYTAAQIYQFWNNPTLLSPDANPALTQSCVALYFNQLNSFG